MYRNSRLVFSLTRCYHRRVSSCVWNWCSGDLLAMYPPSHPFKKFLHTDTTLQKEGIFQKVANVFNFQRKPFLRWRAFQLYENLTTHVDYPNFFNLFKLDDTYNSWFLVTELHVWMLMVRLMSEGDDGRFCRNCLVESLWQDCNARARKLCPDNVALVTRQINDLGDQFQAAIVGYDEGLLSDDTVLGSAVWRRMFNKEIGDLRHIEIVVRYIRFEINHLETLSKEELLGGKPVKWSKLTPHRDDVMCT